MWRRWRVVPDGPDYGGNLGVTLPTCAINFSKSIIQVGETMTGSWSSTNATSASLAYKQNGVSYPSAPLTTSGSTTHVGVVTTEFIMTVVGPGGTASCSKTLTVLPSTPAPTCSIKLSKTSVNSGELVVVNGYTTNATSFSIQGIGNINLMGGDAVSQFTHPTVTTTYVGTVVGVGGTSTCSATVNVSVPPAPSCTLVLSQTTTPTIPGGLITLYGKTTNAVSYVLNQGIGAYAINNNPNPGDTAVTFISPTDTTTYTATVTSATGQTATCSATVTKSPVITAPSCTLVLSQTTTPTIPGGLITLYGKTTNAVSYVLNQGIGAYAINNNPNPGDTAVTFISPTDTTTYTATVTSATGQTATCSATVTASIIPPPPVVPTPTCSMSSNPAVIGVGANSTVTWTTTNVASASFDKGITSTAVNGSSVVSPFADTTYTGTFVGTDGSTISCNATVTVITSPPPPPVIPAPTCSMSASPSAIILGNSSNITWTTTNVALASIDNGVGASAVNGSASVTPSATTVYTGTFVGTDGSTISCNTTVTVSGTSSSAPTCSMNASPNAVAPGGSSTLTWTSTNSTSASIDNGIGSVNTNGSTSITPAAANTYTGTFIGPGGSVTCSASVSVSSSVCTVNCGVVGIILLT